MFLTKNMMERIETTPHVNEDTEEEAVPEGNKDNTMADPEVTPLVIWMKVLVFIRRSLER